MRYIVSIGENKYDIDIRDVGEQQAIKVDGRAVSSSIISGKNQHHFLMLLDAKSYDAEVFRNDGEICVFLHGREFYCNVEDQRLAEIRKAAGLKSIDSKRELHAPMPGLVMRILRQPGDVVKKGDPLLVVEAMKMENELKSPTDGTIVKIDAVVGKPVDKGAVLVTFQH